MKLRRSCKKFKAACGLKIASSEQPTLNVFVEQVIFSGGKSASQPRLPLLHPLAASAPLDALYIPGPPSYVNTLPKWLAHASLP